MCSGLPVLQNPWTFRQSLVWEEADLHLELVFLLQWYEFRPVWAEKRIFISNETHVANTWRQAQNLKMYILIMHKPTLTRLPAWKWNSLLNNADVNGWKSSPAQCCYRWCRYLCAEQWKQFNIAMWPFKCKLTSKWTGFKRQIEWMETS